MTYRHPLRLHEVWYYVDRLNKPTRDVLEVAWLSKSGEPMRRLAMEVITLVPTRTRYFGPKSMKQPRLVVVACNAKVYWQSGGVAMIGRAK